jgi:hypothetical protein
MSLSVVAIAILAAFLAAEIAFDVTDEARQFVAQVRAHRSETARVRAEQAAADAARHKAREEEAAQERTRQVAQGAREVQERCIREAPDRIYMHGLLDTRMTLSPPWRGGCIADASLLVDAMRQVVAMAPLKYERVPRKWKFLDPRDADGSAGAFLIDLMRKLPDGLYVDAIERVQVWNQGMFNTHGLDFEIVQLADDAAAPCA